MRTKLFFAIMAFSLSAAAQVIDYHYCVPKVSNFLTAKKGEAKIYKEPSKNSPVLWRGCLNETDDCSFMWSDEKLDDYDSEIYTIAKDTDVILSIDETEDFYKVVMGNPNENVPGYMAKQDMTPGRIEKVTLDDLRARPGEYIVIEEGPCKGLIIKTWSDEPWGENDLMVGNLYNGMLIFSHHVFGRMLYNTDQKRFEMGGEDGVLLVHYGPKQARKTDEGFYPLDPQKITRTHLESFLRLLNAQQQPDYLEVIVKRDGELYTTYSGPITDTTPLFLRHQKLNETTHIGFKQD